MRKKTWLPGKILPQFIAANRGIPEKSSE